VDDNLRTYTWTFRLVFSDYTDWLVVAVIIAFALYYELSTAFLLLIKWRLGLVVCGPAFYILQFQVLQVRVLLFRPLPPVPTFSGPTFSFDPFRPLLGKKPCTVVCPATRSAGMAQKAQAVHFTRPFDRHGLCACLLGSYHCQLKGDKGDEPPRKGLHSLCVNLPFSFLLTSC